MKKQIDSVDDYISKFPKEVQEKLNWIRKEIIDIAPKSVESISYGMPAYKLNEKPLVYFGGFANHIGFYATPTGHEKFKKALSKYKQGKGSVQFPLEQQLPHEIITELIKFRVNENLKK
ncbi:Uncharacterized conserved protein YdhG, YjbR/CyaY-like superfamily, DUF1801 family [Maribacter sedimenticola]|uniref:Uncharacterized conserved protein YdhG, YjbR/CyaY-like superfamily, DUF1801 family n=1 Tax=Maribacter sedimenticola TaxID=228956 RepID=A0ABY1SHM3_9FLAO|nr:DUF1801 domain-containing protein [Maribacter sedimenticola]SNR54396.1 Uncharacterized conserved protein YdhG, YjbR/CyaY-like superfamily, DUF1801 family [Maribacter sedimenticola]